MQEFSTVIASSYDAESLAPMLTEKAADGWSIVSIVSAGTNVIAYLTRGGETDGPAVAAPAAIVGAADVSTEVADTAADDGVPVAADDGAIDDATITMPAQESAPTADDASGTDSSDATPMLTDGDHDESAALTTIGSTDLAESGGATTGLAGGLAGGVTETPEQLPADQMAAAAAPVDETTESPTEDTGAAASTEATDTTEAAAATETPADNDTTDDGATDDAATDDAATPEPSGVPAGWYADPSGRYELRYWDGAAWTEHVSRAGQQYTDPPVA